MCQESVERPYDLSSLGNDPQFEVYETTANGFVALGSKLQGLFFFDYLKEFVVDSLDYST